MDALRIGLIVVSAPRLYAALGLALLVLLAELMAARDRRRALRSSGAADRVAAASSSALDEVLQGGTSRLGGLKVTDGRTADAAWAWNALFATVIGSRVGFVLENLGYYRQEPLQALAFWQGGFSPWWGVALGSLVALWSLQRSQQRLVAAVLPAAAALSVWLIVPLLLSPAADKQLAFPAGQMERLDGTEFRFEAGTPTVINLWASWCIPCRREMPQLARAAADNPNVRVLYVNQGEDAAAVSAFLAHYPDVNLGNVLLDRNQRVGNTLGSVGLPTTYFFDASGAHIKTHVGEISGPAVAKEMRALVADPGQ